MQKDNCGFKFRGSFFSPDIFVGPLVWQWLTPIMEPIVLSWNNPWFRRPLHCCRNDQLNSGYKLNISQATYIIYPSFKKPLSCFFHKLWLKIFFLFCISQKHSEQRYSLWLSSLSSLNILNILLSLEVEHSAWHYLCRILVFGLTSQATKRNKTLDVTEFLHFPKHFSCNVFKCVVSSFDKTEKHKQMECS